MTIRTDAALTRRVVSARLVLSTAVLGGAFALAGLGAFGDLSDTGHGNVGNGIATRPDGTTDCVRVARGTTFPLLKGSSTCGT